MKAAEALHAVQEAIARKSGKKTVGESSSAIEAQGLEEPAPARTPPEVNP